MEERVQRWEAEALAEVEMQEGAETRAEPGGEDERPHEPGDTDPAGPTVRGDRGLAAVLNEDAPALDNDEAIEEEEEEDLYGPG